MRASAEIQGVSDAQGPVLGHRELLVAIACELVRSGRSERGHPVTPVDHRQVYLIDLRTQESEGSGGERQKLVCSGRRTEERYRVDGPTDDTVTGSRDETVKQTQLTRSSRK